MKLTHVTLEGCGRFGTLTRVEGFGPGVNILSAGNEAGKSTLFRAIRTCLFERHNTTKDDVASLATEGLSLPVTITVGFEKGGKTYEIRKSFLRSRSASLICDGVETARNTEADEEVWKLLGIEQRSTRALDEAAFGVLWVAQGHSFQTPDPSEGARNALNAVIQQEVGTLVGGERARLLLTTVSEELGRYVTERGQPKARGPLDDAVKASQKLTADSADADTRLEALRGKLDELDALRRQYTQASDPAALKSLEDQLTEAKRKLAEAEKAEGEIRRLTGEERQAFQLCQAQQEKLKALQDQATTIDEQRERLTQIAAGLAPLDAQDEATARALSQANAERTRREDALAAIDAREAELQRLEALSQKLARKAELAARLQQLDDFRQRAAASEAALKLATIDDAVIKSLEAIESEEARIRAALAAGAARVTIAAKPGAGVTLNGDAVDGTAARPVTEALIIAVGPDVSITISPPAEALDAATAGLARERARLNALLARHAVASPAQLRQRHAERVTLENIARDLRAERSALGLKEDVSIEINRLATAIAAIAAEAQRILPEGTGPLPAADAIAAERQSLAESRSALRAEQSSLDAQIGAHKDTLTALASTRGTLNGQKAEINARLQSALALLPDDTRQTLMAACEEELVHRSEAHRVKAAALEQGRASAPAPDEAERQKNRIDRFTAALESQRTTLDDLRQSIARREGEVQISGGEGLGELATTFRLQKDMAIAEAQRLAERVEVLKLLKTTVESCYARRREQLNAPLLRHLKPFLNDVFPKAEIVLGDDFEISALSRSGPQGEAFDRLSLGTQEQIAVLVRLAMGAMICERGEDVPVILDDALVFSDDARIEQMFDAISRAGKTQQVIVFTCRARSFASLGGRELRIAGGNNPARTG